LSKDQTDRRRTSEVRQLILVSLEEEGAGNQELVEVDEAWSREIVRRISELRAGRVRPIPGPDVFNEIEDVTK
jgi:hypothetical protein